MWRLFLDYRNHIAAVVCLRFLGCLVVYPQFGRERRPRRSAWAFGLTRGSNVAAAQQCGPGACPSHRTFGLLNVIWFVGKKDMFVGDGHRTSREFATGLCEAVRQLRKADRADGAAGGRGRPPLRFRIYIIINHIALCKWWVPPRGTWVRRIYMVAPEKQICL